MRKWYRYWTQSDEITKQVVSQLAQAPIFQIPWGQNLLIIYISMFTSHGIIIMCPSTATRIPIDRNTYLHQHVYQSRYYHHVPTTVTRISIEICITIYRDTCRCRGAHDDNTVTGKHADVDMYYALVYQSRYYHHDPNTVTRIPIDRNTYLHQHV
jgi:hypothetical protein